MRSPDFHAAFGSKSKDIPKRAKRKEFSASVGSPSAHIMKIGQVAAST